MTTLLVATGGTIASRPSAEGVQGALDGAELLARAAIDAAGVDVIDLGQGPSWAFAPEALERIARTAVDGAVDGRHEGVVVTHGTDLLEESLFLTWLLGGAAASERCPIVFTGSMRHADHEAADGPGNLRDAFALAGTGGGAGPVLCLAGTTHHARWARKTDTAAIDTFRSVGLGAPDPPSPPPPYGETLEGAVVEVHSYAGVGPDVVDRALDDGARGLVVIGTGAGNVHANLAAGIVRAIGAGVPVVVTSRCFTGPVLAEYGGTGGGRWLADEGAILAGDLPTNKARLALSVALGADPDAEAVRAWFAALLGAG